MRRLFVKAVLENEDIWNIAKRYNTSAAAIEAENEVADGKVSGLLLIPIV